jgi:hypothetical protein
MSTTPDEVEHEAARRAWKSGDYATASKHWRAADTLRPTSKYALNVARMEVLQKRHQAAWHWLELVRKRKRLGLERRDIRAHKQLVIACRRILERDHVLLRLVLSGSATERVVVGRNGRPWPAPYVGWSPGDRSRLVIRADNRVVLDEFWKHPVGEAAKARHFRVPEVVVRNARPPSRRTRQGPAAVWDPPLEAVEHTESNYRVAKWTTFGVALALSGVGAGLYAHSFTLNSDIESLNSDFNDGAISVTEYNPKYDSLVADQEAFYPAGIGLMAAGGALMAASVVLFILDIEAGPTVETTHDSVITGGFFRF